MSQINGHIIVINREAAAREDIIVASVFHREGIATMEDIEVAIRIGMTMVVIGNDTEVWRCFIYGSSMMNA